MTQQDYRKGVPVPKLCHRRRIGSRFLSIARAAFAPNCRFVLAGFMGGGFGEDGFAVLWRIDLTSERPKLIEVARVGADALAATLGEYYLHCLAFSSDNRLVAVGSADRHITLLQIEETPTSVALVPIERRRTLNGRPYVVAFSPEGQALLCDDISVASESGASMWLLEDGSYSPDIWLQDERYGANYLDVIAVAFSANGNYAIAGWSVLGASIWQLDLHRESPSVKLVPVELSHPPSKDPLISDGVVTVALSADGSWALTGCANGTTVFWHLDLAAEPPTAQRVYKIDEKPSSHATFLPHSPEALIVQGETIGRWRYGLTGGEPYVSQVDTIEIEDPEGEISVLAVSPDSKWALCSSSDDISLWAL